MTEKVNLPKELAIMERNIDNYSQALTINYHLSTKTKYKCYLIRCYLIDEILRVKCLIRKQIINDLSNFGETFSRQDISRLLHTIDTVITDKEILQSANRSSRVHIRVKKVEDLAKLLAEYYMWLISKTSGVMRMVSISPHNGLAKSYTIHSSLLNLPKELLSDNQELLEIKKKHPEFRVCAKNVYEGIGLAHLEIESRPEVVVIEDNK